MSRLLVHSVLALAATFGLWSCSGDSSKASAVAEPPKTNVQIPQIVTQEQLLIRIHSVPYVYWENRTNSREKLTVRSNQLPFPEIEVTNWTALTNFEYSTNTYEKTLTQQVRLAPVYISNRMTRTNWNTNKEAQAVYNFYFTGPDSKRFEVTNWIRVYTNFPMTNRIVLTTNWFVETNFSVETNTRLVHVILSNKPVFATETVVSTNYFLESNRVESINAKTNWNRTAEVRTNWVSVELILPRPPAAFAKERPAYLFPLILLIALAAGLLGWVLSRRFHKPKPVVLPPLLPYFGSAPALPAPPTPMPKEAPAKVAAPPVEKKKKPASKKKPAKKKENSELKRWDEAMSKVARSLPKKKYQI